MVGETPYVDSGLAFVKDAGVSSALIRYHLMSGNMLVIAVVGLPGYGGMVPS